jgi:hypothetical protein
MKTIVLIVASPALTAALSISSPTVANAAAGVCGPLGAHFAQKTSTDSPCYQIRARLEAYDIISKKTSYMYGKWVTAGRSDSANATEVFPSYTTVTDTFEKKSDL